MESQATSQREAVDAVSLRLVETASRLEIAQQVHFVCLSRVYYVPVAAVTAVRYARVLF